MAIKFRNEIYWNPVEWISRSLFRELIKLPNLTNTDFEEKVKEEISKSIELHTYLLDFKNYEPYKLEIFKEITQLVIDKIEVKEDFQEGFNDKITELNELLDSEIKSRIKNSDWNEINDWETEGNIKKTHLEEWAFSENGYLLEQDEDLLMYDPEMVIPLFELLGMKWNRRDEDIKNILFNYYQYIHQRIKNEEALQKFNIILNTENPNEEQIQLIEKIKPS